MPNEHSNPNADEVQIVINGQPYSLPKGTASHYDIVRRGFAGASEAEANAYTVTYDRGHDNQQSGVLPPGGSVKLKKDMEFDVTSTGMS